MLDINGEKRQRDVGQRRVNIFALLNTASYTNIFDLYILINFTFFIKVLSSYIHSKALSIIVTYHDR